MSQKQMDGYDAITDDIVVQPSFETRGGRGKSFGRGLNLGNFSEDIPVKHDKTENEYSGLELSVGEEKLDQITSLMNRCSLGEDIGTSD